MNVIVDTCIIMDAVMNRDGFAEDAKKITDFAALRRFNGFLTANTVLDSYYMIHGFLHDAVATHEAVEAICESFKILDITGTCCINAFSSCITDYEDAVIEDTAVCNGIDCIVTRNVKDYKNSRISVLTPKEFLSLLTAN